MNQIVKNQFHQSQQQVRSFSQPLHQQRETPQKFTQPPPLLMDFQQQHHLYELPIRLSYPLAQRHPLFLAQRSTPISFQLVVLVPNLRSLDFELSTYMCFLSSLSYQHFCFSLRVYYFLRLYYWRCYLCTWMSKSYLSQSACERCLAYSNLNLQSMAGDPSKKSPTCSSLNV